MPKLTKKLSKPWNTNLKCKDSSIPGVVNKEKISSTMKLTPEGGDQVIKMSFPRRFIKLNRNMNMKKCLYCSFENYTPDNMKGHMREKHPDMYKHYKDTPNVKTNCPLPMKQEPSRHCNAVHDQFSMWRHIKAIFRK